MDFQTDMASVALGELQCVGDYLLVVEQDSCTQSSLIGLVQIAVERSGINLLLAVLRVRQFRRKVAIVGE